MKLYSHNYSLVLLFQGQKTHPQKRPFEDLNKEELIVKCKGLLALAQKAKQAKSGTLIVFYKINKFRI